MEEKMLSKDIDDPRIIKAEPTKELFVFILVRDLTLSDAIGDLVDNSIDGAKRIRPDVDAGKSKNILNPDGKYIGLTIDITLEPDKFSIVDNCGGISSRVARDYAFRFGRPKDMPNSPGSVGQFGIGMKRALFKLGSHFRIESTYTHSRFLVEVNVDDWINEEEWNFRFTELEERDSSDEPFDSSELGTKILVDNLREGTVSSFKLNKFINQLRQEIEKEQFYNILRGLSITINDEALKARQLYLLESDLIKTAFWNDSFNIKQDSTENTLNVEIYAGVSDPVTEEGGWNIFCNDRLVLGNDQSLITGWGDKIPVYHSQYNRFRGYVFFNSDVASLLPWNTVKNGMDWGNPYFQRARSEMIKMMRPVINFLNEIHSERGKFPDSDERILEQTLANTNQIELAKIDKDQKVFASPKQEPKTLLKLSRISYSKPLKKVEEAKRFFDVSSNTNVGSETFDYWYAAEIGEE